MATVRRLHAAFPQTVEVSGGSEDHDPMPHMIYVSSITTESFLHLGRSGPSFCLRRYLGPTQVIEILRDSPGYTRLDLEKDLAKPESMAISVPGPPYTVTVFWYSQHTRRLNVMYIGRPRLGPMDGLTKEFRELLDALCDSADGDCESKVAEEPE